MKNKKEAPESKLDKDTSTIEESIFKGPEPSLTYTSPLSSYSLAKKIEAEAYAKQYEDFKNHYKNYSLKKSQDKLSMKVPTAWMDEPSMLSQSSLSIKSGDQALFIRKDRSIKIEYLEPGILAMAIWKKNVMLPPPPITLQGKDLPTQEPKVHETTYLRQMYVNGYWIYREA